VPADPSIKQPNRADSLKKGWSKDDCREKMLCGRGRKDIIRYKDEMHKKG
jgi:hypothetical protein